MTFSKPNSNFQHHELKGMVNPRCFFPNGIELSRLISILGSKKLLGLL